MQFQLPLNVVVILLLRFNFLTVIHGDDSLLNPRPCVPRDFGRGSFVCVCNSTYCDLSAQLVIPDRRQRSSETRPEVQIYTSTKNGLRLHKSTASFTKTFSTFSNSPNGIYGQEIEKRSVQGFLSTILGLRSRSSKSPKLGPKNLPNRSGFLHVRKKARYQEIIGFGGSFTDSAGENIRKLSWSSQERLMESYFSPAGSDYSLGRIPIGGTDFSPRPYTLDDTAHDRVDFNLTHFALQPEDFNLKIPFIQWAESLRGGRPLRYLASPWSAPVWMKTNRRLNGSGFLRKEFYQIWAEYFVKFIESYAQNGISIWGVTTGNEPMNGFVPGFPFNCMAWSPYDMSKFISENLGPTLRARFPTQKVQIIMLDDNKVVIPAWGRNVLDPNRSSSTYVDGVGTHWYFDFLVSKDALTQFHEAHPHYFILSTEACLGFLPWETEKVILGSWERGETYLEAIINDMRNWVSGWIDWNLALDMTGGYNWAGWRADAAIIVNPKKDEFLKQPIFYGISHVSKFVPPGSIRIGLKQKSLPEALHAVAFLRPDNGTVIVLLNKSSKSVRITLFDDERNGNYLFKIPAKAMQTIVYW